MHLKDLKKRVKNQVFYLNLKKESVTKNLAYRKRKSLLQLGKDLLKKLEKLLLLKGINEEIYVY